MVRWHKVLLTRVHGIGDILNHPSSDLTQEEEYQMKRLAYSLQKAMQVIKLSPIMQFMLQTLVFWPLIHLVAGKDEAEKEMASYFVIAIAVAVSAVFTVISRFLWYYCFIYPNETVRMATSRTYHLEETVTRLQKELDQVKKTRIRLTLDKRQSGASMEYGVCIENISTSSIDEVMITLTDILEQDNSFPPKLHHLGNVSTPMRLRSLEGDTQFTLHPSAGQSPAYRVPLFSWQAKTRRFSVTYGSKPVVLSTGKAYRLELSVTGRNMPESLYACWTEVDIRDHLQVSLLPVPIERQAQ